MIERDTYSDTPEPDWYDGSEESSVAYYAQVMSDRPYHFEPIPESVYDAIDYQDADDIAESYEELIDNLLSASEH